MTLTLIPVEGIDEINPGDDLADILSEGLAPHQPRTGDIVVVTHKVVSKAEGAVVEIEGDEADFRQALIEREAAAIVRRRGDLIIAETRHGFICANAGIDRSKTRDGTMVLLPRDPDRSAHHLRTRFEQAFSARMGVIISDTFGRPWRAGLTDVAIGISGVSSILDLRGSTDWMGRRLEVTEIAVADEIAAAADLVMGKTSGIPAALVRGYEAGLGEGRASDLVRLPAQDLFR